MTGRREESLVKKKSAVPPVDSFRKTATTGPRPVATLLRLATRCLGGYNQGETQRVRAPFSYEQKKVPWIIRGTFFCALGEQPDA